MQSADGEVWTIRPARAGQITLAVVGTPFLALGVVSACPGVPTTAPYATGGPPVSRNARRDSRSRVSLAKCAPNLKECAPAERTSHTQCAPETDLYLASGRSSLCVATVTTVGVAGGVSLDAGGGPVSGFGLDPRFVEGSLPGALLQQGGIVSIGQGDRVGQSFALCGGGADQQGNVIVTSVTATSPTVTVKLSGGMSGPTPGANGSLTVTSGGATNTFTRTNQQ